MVNVILLGLLISVIFYELTDISPGGIIVPGLMAAYIWEPVRLLYTVAIALLAYFLVKLFSRRFIVFGKRRFVLLIIVSFILHFIVNLIFGLFFMDFTSLTVAIVGYTASGIIANTCYKQGVLRTVPSLVVVVGIVALVVLSLNWAGIVL